MLTYSTLVDSEASYKQQFIPRRIITIQVPRLTNQSVGRQYKEYVPKQIEQLRNACNSHACVGGTVLVNKYKVIECLEINVKKMDAVLTQTGKHINRLTSIQRLPL